ncbi:hypothetical protein BJ170DRAFT_713614 [Xylariales sp. AK1849]|nr:hypothetical protein BJ170DRAFT_713614 [Xylariales sp. AK1849]
MEHHPEYNHQDHTSEHEGREAIARRRAARGENYGGLRTARGIRERDVSPDRNCALFLTNLPRDVDHRQSLDQVRYLGKVLYLHINRPIIQTDPSHGPNRPRCAASLAFFTPEPARIMHQRTRSQPLIIGGRKVLVRINDNGSEPRYHLTGRSRRLIIEGSRKFARVDFLTHYLRLSDVRWDNDVIIVTQLEDGGQRIDWHFASYRKQAESAFKIIENELADILTVRFGPDRCCN